MSVVAEQPPVEEAKSSSTQDASPPIHLHCADALNAEFTGDEMGERAKAVLRSAPRMPAVALYGGRYGERWHVDMVALTHNAVRFQLSNAFTMANALGKLVLDVAEADLARVYAWLGTLESFVRAVFDVEDKFIYPLVDSHVKNARTSDGNPVFLTEILSVRGRREAKSTVLDLLASARKTRDVATGETPAKINALRYALDQFGANILDYFAVMDKFAPKLLKRALRHGERDKQKMEKKMFAFMREQGTLLAALVLQGIESRSKRKDFLERNIRKVKEREEFKAYVKSVENTHMQLPLAFNNVSVQYERRFNVGLFIEQYDANNLGRQALEMLADVDINYEPKEGDPPTEDVFAQQSNQLVVRGAGSSDPVGLDDDIIEVRADAEDES